MSDMNLNENRRNRNDVGKETVFTESTVTVDPKKAKKAKKKSMLRTQKRLIAILLVVVTLLGVSAAVVQKIVSRNVFIDTKGDGEKYYVMVKGGKYVITDKKEYTLSMTDDKKHYVTNAGNVIDVNESTGEVTYYAYVDTEGNEAVGNQDRILIFPHTQKAQVQKLEIHNQTGSYTFVRKKMDDGSTDFVIKGHEEIPYSPELFAQLVVSCGYTITLGKIDNELVKKYGHAEYGLVEEERVDEEGNKYTYTPSWYKLTDTSGNVHKVIIGNKLPSEAGYYVKYADRDSVYMITNSGYDASLMLPIESLCKPVISAPATIGDYFDVTNFIYWNDTTDLSDPFKVKPLITFDYLDLEERNLTEFQTTPYYSFTSLEYEDDDGSKKTIDVTPKIGNHFVNEYSINEILTFLYMFQSRTEGVRVASIDLSDEVLKEYGLDYPAYRMLFGFSDIMHDIAFSEKTENGTYYVLSAIYDMIVEIDQKYLPFLEWKDTKWLSYDFAPFNIAFIKELELKTSEFHYTFLCDNSKSDCNEKVQSDKMEVTLKETGATVDLGQFRDYFIALVWTQFDGEADISEEDAKALISDDKNLMFTMRYKTGYRETEFKFYRYSERRVYVTVNGIGGLYIVVPQVEKLIADAQKILTGEPIEGDSRYE
jgi:hypothetical protein